MQDNTRTRPAHGAHAAEGQRRRTRRKGSAGARGGRTSQAHAAEGQRRWTGGQAAPTTLLGQKTTTTPYGKDVDANGYPMKVCEMLQAHEGAYYLERVALWDTAHIIKAKKAIKKAFQFAGFGGQGVLSMGKMIASPVVAEGEADIVVAMNLASMNKFESYVKEGGLLVLDSDRIDVDPERTDITVVKVPADSIAKELGNPKVMNMVVLGAMLKARPIFDADIVIANLAEVLGPKKANLVELNKKAVEMGAAQAVD